MRELTKSDFGEGFFCYTAPVTQRVTLTLGAPPVPPLKTSPIFIEEYIVYNICKTRVLTTSKIVSQILLKFCLVG